MARDGNGIYNRPVAPYVYDAVISETDVNSEMDQMATALTDSIAKDGQTVPTAHLPMGGYKHTGVAAATAQTDYLRVDQAQKNTLCYLTSVGGTADAITATAALGMTALTAGMRFSFIPASTSTNATVTLNVNAIGAVTLKRTGTTALQVGDIVQDRPAEVLYDGTNFQLLNPQKITATSGLGVAAFEALGADIVDDGSGNLTSRTVPSQKTADYSLAATDRNKLFYFFITSATATATCLDAATAGSGYTVKFVNQFASTKPLILAVASGSGFYHPNGSNSPTITLQPGESCAIYSSGGVYFVLELVRNKTAIQGGFKNLKIVAPDGTTAPVVTADQVTVEDAGGRAMRLSSLNVTMNLGTTGAGGLDTGTITAAKMYFIWAIAKEDGTQSALASLSSTAPSPMPAGYTMMARIGTVVTKQGAGTLLGTRQYGRSVQYAQPVTIASGAQGTYSATAPTWAEKTVSANAGATAIVPLTASKIVIIGNGNLGNGTSQYTYAAPNASYGGYQSSNPPPIMAGVVNGAMAFGTFALEATTIQVVGSGTASAVYCLGWDENF